MSYAASNTNKHPRQKPFSGVKVIDISTFLAAPLGAMFLADFGADVIKVERPDTGDEARYWGRNKNGVGLYYKVLSRGKKSVTADLRTPLGREIVKRLVSDADILIENYRPGTIEKWGLGPDVLQQINPGLIILRVTGFGQTGPYSKRPGFGTLAEAFSGFVNINGEPDRPPLLCGFGLADATSGLMAAFLAATALHEKHSSGRGQVIDLAIYETLFALLGPQVVDYDQLGEVQQRLGSRLPFAAPRNTYQTKDGKWVTIAGPAQSTFERICSALDIPELVEDPRFRGNRERLENTPQLDEALQNAIGQFEFADLMNRFDEVDAPVAPVNNVAQILEDPHFAERENVTKIHDDELGSPIRMQSVVGKFSETPGEIRSTGPRLGAHNREVLIDSLGFTEDELKAAGLPVDKN